MQKEIENKEDLVRLVDTFYGRVFQDALLAPHFKSLDFEAHKPRMVQFWAFVLLDETGYTTNVFDKHRHLNIDARHFDKWLEIFNQTIDDLFIGEKADTAKFRAKTLAWTFSEKMKHINNHT
ncbi:MAG: group III truncated hemoglobin [Flavobacteriales bacterium]|nr:group III truncated hemoglobin [Flavobacteriales bacterium]